MPTAAAPSPRRSGGERRAVEHPRRVGVEEVHGATERDLQHEEAAAEAEAPQELGAEARAAAQQGQQARYAAVGVDQVDEEEAEEGGYAGGVVDADVGGDGARQLGGRDQDEEKGVDVLERGREVDDAGSCVLAAPSTRRKIGI